MKTKKNLKKLKSIIVGKNKSTSIILIKLIKDIEYKKYYKKTYF